MSTGDTRTKQNTEAGRVQSWSRRTLLITQTFQMCRIVGLKDQDP